MRNFFIILLLLASGTAYSQIRAFDNSKAVLPWLYNPAASLSHDFQAYIGYDGRGNGNFMPQSVVAGLRMPVQGGKRFRHKGPSSMMGVQLLNTSHDLLKSSTINASFAHEIPVSREVTVAMGVGAGIFNMRYNYDALVYMDQQDPLLNNGENFFNIHLNAGFSLVMKEKFFVHLAAPYLIKDERANIKEVVFRMGYSFPLNADLSLIAAGSLDTYNHNLIYGGDIRAEWRKMISLMAGADRYKYHGGILLDIKPFSLGYTYGLNFKDVIDYVPAHQIAVFSNIPLR
ncbi:MAG: type IX secretion system membrane protein PorP/SprF [Chryseosolibacter sp.]